MKTYARLLPAGIEATARETFYRLLEASDEDGMAGFFRQIPASPPLGRALEILREAREIGDRLNVMDRTLPVLPHTEIAACYVRLRSIGDELANLEAAGSFTA
jgi:hypothetical protein